MKDVSLSWKGYYMFAALAHLAEMKQNPKMFFYLCKKCENCWRIHLVSDYVFLLLIICSIQLQGTRVFEQTEWHYWAMGVSFHLALLFMDRTRRVKMVFVKILLLESHQLQFTEFKQTAVNLSNHLLPGKDSADRDVHLQPGMSRSYFKSKL